MHELIDFDARFQDYLTTWAKENASSFKTVEDMETALPEVYDKWCNENRGIFMSCAGKELVDWLTEYIAADVSVPDMLFDSIAQKRTETEGLVYKLLIEGQYKDEVRMLFINLLSSMDSELPIKLYISWILSADEQDDISDSAAEALMELADKAEQPVISALQKAKTPQSCSSIANIAVEISKATVVFDSLISFFKTDTTNRILYAALLGKFGDDRAIPVLADVLENPQLSYLEYVEIKNAIEELGGTVTNTREFHGDKDYEALAGLE